MYIINPNQHSDREVADVLEKRGVEHSIVIALKHPDQIDLYKRFNPTYCVEKFTEDITEDLCVKCIEDGYRVITPGEYRKARLTNLPELDTHRLPPELVKVSLGLMSASLKECLRIGSMALVCRIVDSGDKILAIGGRNGRLDTAAVILPGFAPDFVDAKVIEIKCAPYDQ